MIFHFKEIKLLRLIKLFNDSMYNDFIFFHTRGGKEYNCNYISDSLVEK